MDRIWVSDLSLVKGFDKRDVFNLRLKLFFLLSRIEIES
jgi:hypothetical protein